MRHEYSKWRHGGWYVHTVQYPSGAIGCVSNNYPDKKWRIACGDRRNVDFTFPTREAAADGEFELVRVMRLNAAAPDLLSALKALVPMAIEDVEEHGGDGQADARVIAAKTAIAKAED